MRYEHDSLYSLQRLVPTDPAVDFRAFYPYTPNEVKHRRRTTGSQLKVLETVFRVDTKPNATLRNDLAAQLGMTPRGVQVSSFLARPLVPQVTSAHPALLHIQVWFQNRYNLFLLPSPLVPLC